MTNFPIEVVQKIVSYLQDIKNPNYLFSALMVNRDWCKVSVPFLWEITLDYSPDKYNSYKCIRTYLSNANEESRIFLTHHGMDLLSSPPWTSFNYATYLNSINYHHLAVLIESYLSKINNRNFDDFISAKERILFQELCKLFMKRSRSMKRIIIPDTIRLDGIIGEIPYITRYDGANRCLKGLKELYCYWNFNETFYKSILQFCKNIQVIKIYIDAYYDMDSLANLISLQNNLKQLKIEVQELIMGNMVSNDYCTPLFNSILNQSHSIQKLELVNFSFQYADSKTLERLIISCKYLRFLSIYQCKYLENQQFNSTDNFHSLEELYYCLRVDDIFPEKLLVGIFKTANTKLRKIKLSYHTIKVIRAIIFNCLNVEILNLSTISLSHNIILRIFDTCTRLKHFTFEGERGYDENDLLIQMSKYVPITLETLEIKMLLQYPWIFSAASLKVFLKASKNLRLLKIIHKEPQQTLDQQFSNPLTPKNSSMKILTKDHFDVIEELGIGLYMSSGIKFSKKLYPNYVHTIVIPSKK
ncbi:16955_t:CDS:1 [Funneliformis geosporum]|uniref:16761_t:CDS:1 n=1 Tax=Funneliformis geosporum TaxID=1117311 RepID=A0A9W4SE76_9GLOM|nr:16955_t:CDS:1 [Funneliformis geosporum]CAI2163909.1 16761_t:CDS:1 [Funneliformis geosporum]